MNFLMLPDDLLLNCLSRVSRLYYPTLSLVCKRFRSLLALVEHYNIRTVLGCTESCLYVYLWSYNAPYRRWFTLCRRPTQLIDSNPNPRWLTSCFAPYRTIMNRFRNKGKKSKSENILVSVPTRTPSSVGLRGLVAVGYNIYHIGGYENDLPSSRVIRLDCRSHTWLEAPSMQVARKLTHMSVLDEKIYVFQEEESIDHTTNWIECFDTRTHKWEHVPSPDAETRMSIYKSIAINGKLYLFGDKCVVYNPKEHRWDVVETMEMRHSWILDPSCVVDNVLYGYRWYEKKLEWYDFEGGSWRVVKGLEKIMHKLPKDCDRVRLVGCGRKIAFLWDKDESDEVEVEEKTIWCAEISLKRHKEKEIRGKVEWCDVVLRVSKSYIFFDIFFVTV